MAKFSLSGLRSRAIVLVLLAIFPLLALTLYSYFDQRDRAIREVQRDEIVAARNLATTQETLINKTRQLLMTLARLPQMQHRDRDAGNALFAALLEQSPHSASIAATDSEGRLFASAPAPPGPVNYADRPWFRKVIQTKDFVIGETVLGRISGKYGNILAYPILDDEGRFLGALATQLNLQWLGSLLAENNLPPTTAMVLTDSTCKVLFRYPNPQEYIGTMVPDFLVKDMAISDEGVAAGVGLLGDERLFCFTRLSPPLQGMRLIIGIPLDWAVNPVNRVLWRNLTWLGLVALFAMAAAWYGGDLFIVRPVKKLQAVIGRLAAGDLTVRSGPDYEVGELGLLAHSFDQMADSLQARMEETKRLLNVIQIEKDKLTALINSINDEVWFADTQKKFTLANPSALREFGLGSTEAIEVEKLVENLEVCRADGSPRPVEETPPLRALQGEIVRNFEEIIRTPASGEPRYRQVSAAPVRDVNGNIIGSVSVVRDITELKRAEEGLRQAKDDLEQRVQERTAQLREQAELIQDLYNNAPCGYHSLAPDGTFVQINNTELNWLGYTRDEVVGRMKFSDLLTADSLNTFQKNFPDFKERGWARNLEFELLRKDGSTLPVLLSATTIKDEAGNYMMSRSTVYDIRDRKLAERVIKESEARLRYLASRLLTAQEDERRRIARDLHEDLGQSLAVLKLQLGAFGRSLPEEIREAKSGIDELHNHINEIVDEVRGITYNLRPLVLDLGLTAALHSLVQDFLIDQDMELSLDLCGMNGLFSPEEETGIYRVFQEALTNIFNHAQATRIVITAKQEQDFVAFKIDDNGQGFDLEAVQGHGAQDRRLGLATMDERVRIMGGSLKILSAKTTGTSIAFSIPISPIQKTA